MAFRSRSSLSPLARHRWHPLAHAALLLAAWPAQSQTAAGPTTQTVTVHDRSIRSYLSEPDRGRRRWEGKRDEQKQVYGNRRRIRGERGRRLQKLRAELGERSFAHMFETGAMRRLHLRGRDNSLKRLVVHAAGFNLSLIMRSLIGAGTPRQATKRLLTSLFDVCSRLWGLQRPSALPRTLFHPTLDRFWAPSA